MEQMTVAKLFLELADLVKAGYGDKKLAVSVDEEGNAYRGFYYSCISDPDEVAEMLEYSNGIYDNSEEDPNNLVLIG